MNLQVSAQQNLLEDYLRRRHSVSRLMVHLVFTTKYRRKLLDGAMLEQLRRAFGSAAQKLECDILEMDGEADHVHLLVTYPPKLSISVLVNNLKSVSSRYLRAQNAQLPTQGKAGLLWSRSYFASSAGGASIETLKRYMESQRVSKYARLTSPGGLAPYIPARIGRGFTAELLNLTLLPRCPLRNYLQSATNQSEFQTCFQAAMRPRQQT